MTSERIGLFLPTLRGGGAEKVIVHIANALVEKVFLLTWFWLKQRVFF